MQRRDFLLSTIVAPLQAFNKDTLLPDNGFIVKAGDTRRKEKYQIYGKSPIDLKIASSDTDGMFSMYEYTSIMKGGPPLHINLKQDEIFYVLEGSYVFKLQEEIYHLTVGDTICLPKGAAHTFSQRSDRGRVLLMHLPPGKMESYFAALGKLLEPPSPEEGMKLFAEHDMQIVGPPID